MPSPILALPTVGDSDLKCSTFSALQKGVDDHANIVSYTSFHNPHWSEDQLWSIWGTKLLDLLTVSLDVRSA